MGGRKKHDKHIKIKIFFTSFLKKISRLFGFGFFFYIVNLKKKISWSQIMCNTCIYLSLGRLKHVVFNYKM